MILQRKKLMISARSINCSCLLYERMSVISQTIGYTIIEFNYIYNDESVAILIEKLNLSEHIIRNKGFTYADSRHRLIFINESLSDEEKLMDIMHEVIL